MILPPFYFLLFWCSLAAIPKYSYSSSVSIGIFLKDGDSISLQFLVQCLGVATNAV